MNTTDQLLEIQGKWYLNGEPLHIGDILQGRRTRWQVAGFGRRANGARDPFVWVRHEYLGVTILAPSLGEELDAPLTIVKPAVYRGLDEQIRQALEQLQVKR